MFGCFESNLFDKFRVFPFDIFTQWCSGKILSSGTDQRGDGGRGDGRFHNFKNLSLLFSRCIIFGARGAEYDFPLIHFYPRVLV